MAIHKTLLKCCGQFVNIIINNKNTVIGLLSRYFEDICSSWFCIPARIFVYLNQFNWRKFSPPCKPYLYAIHSVWPAVEHKALDWWKSTKDVKLDGWILDLMKQCMMRFQCIWFAVRSCVCSFENSSCFIFQDRFVGTQETSLLTRSRWFNLS